MSFNSERLGLARIYRNYTKSELAEMVNVTTSAISQIESGKPPSGDLLLNLVLALKFPKDFFEQESHKHYEVSNTFFRALVSTRILDKQTQEVKTLFVVEIYNFLKQYLNFPTFVTPHIDLKNIESIQQIAEQVRSAWSLGDKPIENMVSLLESKGIIVSSFAVNNKKIDAFTQVHRNGEDTQYCVVLGNDKQSMVRRNFDAAHELGHILLHNDVDHLDHLDKVEKKRLEDEANAFAAAFLLPASSFYLDLTAPTNLDRYVELKRKWKVSAIAMMMRAKQLNRINPSQFTTLMKKYNYLGMRTGEPYDDIWEIPRPQLFKKAIKILVENKVLQPQEIVTQLAVYGLPMNTHDIEVLLDLDKGTLQGNTTKPSVVLTLKNN